MLLQKKMDVDDIVTIKLISGEEIIGKLKQNPNDVGVLEVLRPIVLGMQQQQNQTTGQLEIGWGFAPFMLGTPDDSAIVIEKGTYITVVKAKEEIKNTYIESTTGIKIPSITI